MHPRRVFFLAEMPLTSAKKVDRAALKTMVEERLATAGDPMIGDRDQPAEQTVAR